MIEEIIIDPNAVTLAFIGAAAGIISALTTFGIKVYEIYKERSGESFESKVVPIIQKAMEPTNRKIDNIQLDVTRMRLLSLIRNEPKDAENILKVGNLYFSTLHGNTEASKLFSHWLVEEDIKCPEWFKYAEINHGSQ